MKWIKKRKLRIDILTAFTCLICLTVFCEIFYASFANKKIVLEFEKNFYSKKISSMAANWLNGYFEEVETVAKTLSKINPNIQNFEMPLLEGIKTIPFALSFYVALKNGEYIQARTTDGLTNMQSNENEKLQSHAKYAIKKIQGSEEGFVETWTYLNDEFETIESETLRNISYDPRKKDWYIKSERKTEALWSDVYQFSTTKLPGMTLSKSLKSDIDGESNGVIAIDFSLFNLKDLLQQIKITENSKSYLINAKHEVIASQNTIYEISASIKNIKDIDDPVLHVAAKNLFASDDFHTRFEVENKLYSAAIQKLSNLPISILIITPQSDLTSSFDDVQSSMLYISFAIFVLSFGVILLLSRRISTPITKLCDSANAIGNMDLENYPEPPSSNIIEIQNLSNSMNAMKLGVSTFSKYAPRELVRKLIKQGVQPELGGQIKKMTMLFSDIEKFSTISERLPSEYLVLHISEYFDELTKEIMRHNGIIDKYIGDSIMALWGAPNPDNNQVVNACSAAMGCTRILNGLKEKWAPLGKPPLPTRFGIHTGSVIVGNMGSQDRMNYTVIGDAVNIASRLEGANKLYKTSILVSEDIENEARGRFLFRVVDKIAVKGRVSGITVFEPLCDMKNADSEEYYKLIELSSKSKEAFELYLNKNFKDALNIYSELHKNYKNFEDSLSILKNRCERFLKDPPKDDWDGIERLNSK